MSKGNPRRQNPKKNGCNGNGRSHKATLLSSNIGTPSKRPNNKAKPRKKDKKK